jgi:CubicO group peptidase (beta-lactamase class C family)
VGEHTPGAAVLVAQGDEALLEAAYGMANLEHDIPVTPDTIFRIGSVTKQFTAVGILLLEQDGLLRVEDPISKFLPDYPRGDEITLRHLLSHTSGIVEYTRAPEFWSNIRLEMPHEEFTGVFRDKPLDFEPGAGWSYSNSGYHLLGIVIENASGMTYEEFMQSRVFSPLGLDDTGYDRPDRILKRRAAGYDRFDGEYKNRRFWDISQLFSAGGLYSTVGDLHAWNRAIMHDQLLSAAEMGRATTRTVLADCSDRDYGFGWGLLESRGLAAMAHAGGLDG